MIDSFHHQPSKGRPPRSLDVVSAKMELVAGMLRGYRPGERLCQFLAPGHTNALDGMAHNDFPENPVRRDLVELVDQALIDWLSQRVDAATTAQRLQNVVAQFRPQADKFSDEDERDIAQMWIETLERICTSTLASDAKRPLALRCVRRFQTALGIADTAPGLPPL